MKSYIWKRHQEVDLYMYLEVSSRVDLYMYLEVSSMDRAIFGSVIKE